MRIGTISGNVFSSITDTRSRSTSCSELVESLNEYSPLNTFLFSLKMLSPEIMKSPPLARGCQLFNPTGNCWSNDAKQHLQKIIANKDVFMVVRDSRYSCFIINLYIHSRENAFTSVADLLFNTCTNVVSSADSTSTTTSRDILFTDVKIYENSFILEPKQTERVVIASVLSPHKVFVQIVSEFRV